MYSRKNGTVSLSIFHRTLIKEHKPQCAEKAHAHIGIKDTFLRLIHLANRVFLINCLAKFG